jgi:translation initiation factor 3 subunit G
MNVFNEKDIELGKEEIEIIDDKKYVTFFRKGDDGIIYKHIKEYKIEKNVIKVPKKVAERRQWAKFGVSKGLPPGPDKASTNRVFDDVFFEFTNNNKIVDDKEDSGLGMFGNNNKNIVTCKHCGGNHWSIKCKNKPDKINPNDNKPISNNGKYIPKFKRDGEKPIDKNKNTIRISNISDSADEQDIRDLFYNYGRITRLYYNQKGFAFLTYSEKNACEKAIEAVNGHPYDYLILSVEMAESKD